MKTDHHHRSANHSRKGILIVEDDPADIALLARQLNGLPALQLCSVGSIKEVDSLLEGVTPYADRVQFPLPRVMFVDIMLPDGDSRQHISRWREKLGPETLIVLTTGSLRPEDLQNFYHKGADTFLAKPISAGDVDQLTTFYSAFFEDSAP